MVIFWGFQDFMIYLKKYFWSLLNYPNLTFQQHFCKSKVNKTVWLVSLKRREIIAVITMTTFSAKIHFSFIRVLKSKKKKLALTALCFVQEIWLDDSWKLFYINQSRFYNLFHAEKLKNVYHNFKILAFLLFFLPAILSVDMFVSLWAKTEKNFYYNISLYTIISFILVCKSIFCYVSRSWNWKML